MRSGIQPQQLSARLQNAGRNRCFQRFGLWGAICIVKQDRLAEAYAVSERHGGIPNSWSVSNYFARSLRLPLVIASIC